MFFEGTGEIEAVISHVFGSSMLSIVEVGVNCDDSIGDYLAEGCLHTLVYLSNTMAKIWSVSS